MKDAYLFDVDVKKKFLRELDMLECLTQKRIEILRAIANSQPDSIRALSRILDRNVKNVFEDLLLLKKHKFISFQEEGKSKKPVVLVRKIVFRFESDDE